jgi:hypothetical protein
LPPQTRRLETVAALASAHAIFPEGQRAFRENGSCLTKASVEEVDIRRASTFLEKDDLLKLGARADDKIPWSALLWYDVADGTACENPR